MIISRIFTSPDVDVSLEKYQLVSQFKKAVQKLKAGNYTGLDLKKCEPKSLNIWSFWVTKKYRAWCRKQGEVLTVYLIDDHP